MVRILACAAVLLGAAGAALAQDFQWPVSGTVSQTFYGTFSGKSSGPYYDDGGALQNFAYTGGDGMHRAIDIAAPGGTPIVASRNGNVLAFPDTGGGYGNHVVIDHGDGYFTLYGHMSVIQASDGQAVATGDLIGQVGCTGHCTGDHVHFEVRYAAGGGGWSYSIPRYYIPSTDGTAVASGAVINFDYPNIGVPTTPPPPGTTTPPVTGGYYNADGVFVGTPDNRGGEGTGEGHEGCGASVGLVPSGGLLMPLALALLALRRGQRRTQRV